MSAQVVGDIVGKTLTMLFFLWLLARYSRRNTFGMVLLVVLAGNAAADTMSKSELVRWTRHFERVAGTAQHVVKFVEIGEPAAYPWCAWSEKFGDKLYVTYNLNYPRGYEVKGTAINEYVLARHEVMHQRAHHHERGCARDENDEPIRVNGCLDRDQMEAEANELERVYK